MNVSQAEFQNMKEDIVKDIIARLMEERKLTMDEAFNVVYTSSLFEKLSNPKTGLYFQSSGYVYSFLENEINAVRSLKRIAATKKEDESKMSLAELEDIVRQGEEDIKKGNFKPIAIDDLWK